MTHLDFTPCGSQVEPRNPETAPDFTASRRRSRLAGTATAILLVASGTTGCGGGDSFAPSASIATFQLEPLSSKKPEFTASTILINAPGQKVEVLGLRPLATPNVEYLGAVTIWPRDRGSITDGGPGYPTEGMTKTHPAIGTVIPAAETAFKHSGDDTPGPVWVNAGFRLTSGDVGAIFDVEVTYRVDDTTRTERSGRVFLVCKAPCEGDKYADVDEWEEAMRKELGIKEVATET